MVNAQILYRENKRGPPGRSQRIYTVNALREPHSYIVGMGPKSRTGHSSMLRRHSRSCRPKTLIESIDLRSVVIRVEF